MFTKLLKSVTSRNYTNSFKVSNQLSRDSLDNSYEDGKISKTQYYSEMFMSK